MAQTSGWHGDHYPMEGFSGGSMLATTLTLAAICATIASIIGVVFKRSGDGAHGRERER